MVPSRVWANTPSEWREEMSTLRSEMSQGEVPLLNLAIRGVGQTTVEWKLGSGNGLVR
jgi:hypothetical protein